MLADGLWVEIESAKVEVNGVGKALLVAEAMAPNLDRLDAAVDAFSRSIADLQNDSIQDTPQVLLDPTGAS